MTPSPPPNSARLLLIGPPASLVRVARQLSVADGPPTIVARLADDPGAPLDLAALANHLQETTPDAVVLAHPAALAARIAELRSAVTALGVPVHAVQCVEDQLAAADLAPTDPAGLLDRPGTPPDADALRRVVAGRTVLITGAGGSIGSELARMAAAHDAGRLVLVDRAENALFDIDVELERTHPHIAREAVLLDVVDAEATHALLARTRPDVVFHSAANKHVPMMERHPGAAVDNNLFGTRAVVDAAEALGTERLVLISTDKAVNPCSVMGATKRLAERYVQFVSGRCGAAYSVVRFGNVLGSAGSVLSIWRDQLAAGGPLTITDPAMTRYFMTIREAAGLVIEAAGLVGDAVAPGAIFALDMGEPVGILDLAQRFIRRHGFVPRLPGDAAPDDGVGIPVVFTGARPGEKLHEDLGFDPGRMEPTPRTGIDIWRLAPPTAAEMEAVFQALDRAQRPHGAGDLARCVLGLIPAASPA